MENTDYFPYAKEAIMCNHQINAFTVSKDEWEHKGGHWYKPIKNALHKLWYAKRHLSGWSDVEQWKKSNP